MYLTGATRFTFLAICSASFVYVKETLYTFASRNFDPSRIVAATYVDQEFQTAQRAVEQ